VARRALLLLQNCQIQDTLAHAHAQSTFNNAHCECVRSCAPEGGCFGVFSISTLRETTLVLRIFLWSAFGSVVATSKFISCFRGAAGKFPLAPVVAPGKGEWKRIALAAPCNFCKHAMTLRLVFWRMAVAISQVFQGFRGCVRWVVVVIWLGRGFSNSESCANCCQNHTERREKLAYDFLNNTNKYLNTVYCRIPQKSM